jgi:hypothetical protein
MPVVYQYQFVGLLIRMMLYMPVINQFVRLTPIQVVIQCSRLLVIHFCCMASCLPGCVIQVGWQQAMFIILLRGLLRLATVQYLKPKVTQVTTKVSHKVVKCRCAGDQRGLDISRLTDRLVMTLCILLV